MVENFHEIAKNHTNVNFCDKIFIIATFFHDYCHAVVPKRTILTCGIGLEVCKPKRKESKEIRNNDNPF